VSEDKTNEQKSEVEKRDTDFLRRNKITLLLGIVLVAGLLCFAYYNDRQKTAAASILVSEGKALIAEGSYEQANKKLSKAVKLKRTDESNELLTKSNQLIESDESFKAGINRLNEGKYKSAIDNFQNVIEDDVKNYATAQSHIKEANAAWAAETLEEAKEMYSEGKHIEAYDTLQEALQISPSLEEAKKLKETYEQAKLQQEEKERIEAEKRAREQAREQMKKYEYGTGVVGIAVGETKRTTRVNGDFGYYNYIKDPQKAQFLWLWIGAANAGNTSVHVNPNDFRVTTPDGYTANYDTASFNTNHLEATDVPPDSYVSGWLIFIVPKADQYTLHYNGWGGSVTKKIVF